MKRKEEIAAVFLHGFLGHPSDWDPLFSFLPGIRCIAPELPGHGSAPLFSSAADFFNSLALPLPIHLVGYSMGGRIALEYASLHPEHIASLTLLSTHLGLSDETLRKERALADELLAKKIQLSFDEFLKTWYDQPIFAGFKPEMTHRRLHNPQKIAQSLLSFSLSKQTPREMPTGLFLVGEKDAKYCALYPEARKIPRAGHMIHLEEPKQIATLLQEQFS